MFEQEQQVATVPHISEVNTKNQISDCYGLLSEVSSNSFLLDEKISTRSSKQLTCYCDGSYSHKNQIGYSGFRASDGFSKYCRCPVRRPRNSSTECEVFAACLVLQYTAKHHYDTLILYTDDSKVEQLFRRPKTKNYDAYPTFFDALKQCREGKRHFHIRVEHVSGHTTWYEQQQCSTKREFAIVDREVRRKRQQHERRLNNNIVYPSFTYYSYQFGGSYIRFIYPEKFGATLIIISSR